MQSESSPTSSQPTAPQTNTWAIASLVLGILSWVALPVIGSFGAVLTGHIARRKIRRSSGQSTGDGLATAGLVLGYVQLGAATIGAIVLLVVLGAGLRTTSAVTSGQPSAGSSQHAFNLTGYDGRTYSSSGLAGQVVVLNFWSSWAAPCQDDVANLEKVWATYKDRGVVVLGVDYVDQSADARAFIDRAGITYPTGPDTGETIARAFKLRGVPETRVLDKQGLVALEIIGPVDYTTLVQRIEGMLAAP